MRCPSCSQTSRARTLRARVFAANVLPAVLTDPNELLKVYTPLLTDSNGEVRMQAARYVIHGLARIKGDKVLPPALIDVMRERLELSETARLTMGLSTGLSLVASLLQVREVDEQGKQLVAQAIEELRPAILPVAKRTLDANVAPHAKKAAQVLAGIGETFSAAPNEKPFPPEE